MSEPSAHPHLRAYLDALRSAVKARTAACYGDHLRRLTQWLTVQGIAPERVTRQDLADFQVWLAQTYRTGRGVALAASTQHTVITVIRSAYAWMRRRGLLLHDPAAALAAPKLPRRLTVAKDHLSQQEAIALTETLAALVQEAPAGTTAHALAQRNLALIIVALASGRRCEGIVDLRLSQVDLILHEIRVEHEKGKSGRVLPIAPWATAALRRYLENGRVRLLRGGTSEFVFLSQRRDRICHKAVAYLLDEAIVATIRRNPDLADLPGKRITTHSLRVSFATLMFQGGCNIRSLNELMLHASLTTTAAYTPIALQEVRRALLAAHPRA